MLCSYTRVFGGRVNSLFSLIPFHHIRVVLVTKCVCSGGGCPLNRQEPSCFRWSCLWCPLKHGPGTHTMWESSHQSLLCRPADSQAVGWLHSRGFYDPLLEGAVCLRFTSVLRPTVWPVFEFQLTVKEQIHHFYDHSSLQPLSPSPQGLMHSRYTGKTG